MFSSAVEQRGASRSSTACICVYKSFFIGTESICFEKQMINKQKKERQNKRLVETEQCSEGFRISNTARERLRPPEVAATAAKSEERLGDSRLMPLMRRCQGSKCAVKVFKYSSDKNDTAFKNNLLGLQHWDQQRPFFQLNARSSTQGSQHVKGFD